MQFSFTSLALKVSSSTRNWIHILFSLCNWTEWTFKNKNKKPTNCLIIMSYIVLCAKLGPFSECAIRGAAQCRCTRTHNQLVCCPYQQQPRSVLLHQVMKSKHTVFASYGKCKKHGKDNTGYLAWRGTRVHVQTIRGHRKQTNDNNKQKNILSSNLQHHIKYTWAKKLNKKSLFIK